MSSESDLRAALSAAGYEPLQRREEIVVQVGDEGNDDPEAAETLAEIQAIAAKFGAEAAWSGASDSWGDGSSTSDIRVDLVESAETLAL